jgi:hypothetical protein
LSWTGYTNRKELELRASDGDELAWRAVLALLAHRRGENVRFSDVDIEDVDSIEGAGLYDDAGREATLKLQDDGQPYLVNGAPVWLFDGQEADDPPPPAASPTD